MPTITFIISMAIIVIAVVYIRMRGRKEGTSLKTKELLFNLGITIVGTLVGVLWAFTVAEIAQQADQDKTTEQRLHLALLEAQYNGTTALDIVDSFTESATTVKLTIERPNSLSAIIAFQDSNILSVLEPYQASLLKSYIYSIANLNEVLNAHQTLLENSNYTSTPLEPNLRKSVRNNAAATFAMTFVLQEELLKYFNEESYVHERIAELEERVKVLKKKALSGEIAHSKKE